MFLSQTFLSLSVSVSFSACIHNTVSEILITTPERLKDGPSELGMVRAQTLHLQPPPSAFTCEEK